MNQRLQQFLDAENITQSQFADSIGVARASISHILAGRNKPGCDFLKSMQDRYPSINLNWFVGGKGRMYNIETQAQQPLPVCNSPDLFALEDDGRSFASVPQPDMLSGGVRPAARPAEVSENPKSALPAGSSAQISAAETPKNALNLTQGNDRERVIVRLTAFYSDGTFEEFARN